MWRVDEQKALHEQGLGVKSKVLWLGKGKLSGY